MLGGVTAAIVGHPFDTIKTRMQSVRICFALSFFTKNAKDSTRTARESEIHTKFIYTTCIVSRSVATLTICTTELDRQFCKFRRSVKIDRRRNDETTFLSGKHIRFVLGIDGHTIRVGEM